MYGIFPYIYHKNQPNEGIYTIHGSYGHPHPQRSGPPTFMQYANEFFSHEEWAVLLTSTLTGHG